MIGKLEPLEIGNIETSNVLWTKENSTTAISPVELLSMPPGSSFQPEQNKCHKKLKISSLHYLKKL